ncbi:hypothetical protein L596_014250 [Steinernema carpocapsae]|uniref:Uncharacterized protein n=1 Tax=Steinernema carpocapsae TaxID=34508 RepID=A0A4U5NBW8_STECR|nr:hypothetical protein L596_014250 [Steinernema carpocapsae]
MPQAENAAFFLCTELYNILNDAAAPAGIYSLAHKVSRKWRVGRFSIQGQFLVRFLLSVKYFKWIQPLALVVNLICYHKWS